jgi:uncharacterized protein DUF5320
MPGYNGTGPQGMGPRTGGGRGYCAPGTGTAYGYGAGMNRGAGRGGIPRGGGRGRAWGGGRGRGWYGPTGFNAPSYDPYYMNAEPGVEQEVEFLKNQSQILEQELGQIRKRIDELEIKNNEGQV